MAVMVKILKGTSYIEGEGLRFDVLITSARRGASLPPTKVGGLLRRRNMSVACDRGKAAETSGVVKK
jgi:hypothetical protein